MIPESLKFYFLLAPFENNSADATFTFVYLTTSCFLSTYFHIRKLQNQTSKIRIPSGFNFNDVICMKCMFFFQILYKNETKHDKTAWKYERLNSMRI